MDPEAECKEQVRRGERGEQRGEAHCDEAARLAAHIRSKAHGQAGDEAGCTDTGVQAHPSPDQSGQSRTQGIQNCASSRKWVGLINACQQG